jgi:uncharacterized protein Yka (UPF0111/DUF47 family)
VQKAVLKETVQHPVTIISVALGVAGGLATVVTREPLIFAATLGFLITGGATWVWNYFGRGEDLARAHVQKLRSQQDSYDDWSINSLEERCADGGWTEGVKELQELMRAYRSAKATCQSERNDSDALRFEALADQGVKEGLELLERGLAVHQALGLVDTVKLEREVRAWKREHSQCQTDRECAAIQRKIDSHQSTLALYARRQESLLEIVAQLNSIGNALEQVALSAPGGSVADLFMTGGAASQLETAVRAASQVEERLRTLGDTSEMDKQAREAAQSARHTN